MDWSKDATAAYMKRYAIENRERMRATRDAYLATEQGKEAARRAWQNQNIKRKLARKGENK